MNGWNRFKASRDFMEWFEGLAGDQTVATLPQSEAFVQAGAAAEAVRTMCRKVSILAGLPFEKKQLKKIDTH